jgi:hypothetical protein
VKHTQRQDVQQASDCERGCAPQDDRHPRRASDKIGNLCAKRLGTKEDRGCADRLRHWIREIGDLAPHLNPSPTSSRNPTAPARRQKVSGSPAGARLDVLIIQDRRTRSTAKYTEDGDDKAQHASAADIVFAWANAMSDDLKLPRVDTYDEAIHQLTRGGFQKLCYLPWIGDLYDEAQALNRSLRRTAGLSGPRPIGRCDCGAPLFQPDPIHPDQREHQSEYSTGDDTIVKCRNCGHRLNALAIVRLEAAQRMQESG